MSDGRCDGHHNQSSFNVTCHFNKNWFFWSSLYHKRPRHAWKLYLHSGRDNIPQKPNKTSSIFHYSILGKDDWAKRASAFLIHSVLKKTSKTSFPTGNKANFATCQLKRAIQYQPEVWTHVFYFHCLKDTSCLKVIMDCHFSLLTWTVPDIIWITAVVKLGYFLYYCILFEDLKRFKKAKNST